MVEKVYQIASNNSWHDAFDIDISVNNIEKRGYDFLISKARYEGNPAEVERLQSACNDALIGWVIRHLIKYNIGRSDKIVNESTLNLEPEISDNSSIMDSEDKPYFPDTDIYGI